MNMGEQQARMAAKELEEIGVHILRQARNELYLGMRFLDVALSSFTYAISAKVDPVGTDGAAIYFHPSHLGGLYRTSRVLVNRAYLHMVLHCLFRHLGGRKERDERLWNLACDIAVESMIDGMFHRSVRFSRSMLRRDIYRRLKEQIPVLNAQSIYRELKSWNLSSDQLEKLSVEYVVDDHVLWESQEERKRQEQNNKWKEIAEQMETDMQTFSKEASDQAGGLEQMLSVENRQKHDYREFLRKFAVLKEEPRLDPDTFDYVFYSYGLQLYGNMPLIEPQETREIKKIQEFVIVIDTSMSCSGTLVERFLEETYSVLSENESFFHKVHIRVLQCDERVQQEQVITNEEELRRYMEQLVLKGGGGTDFRPAFAHVERLVREGVFEQLKGMIYFTDGFGIYPKRMPPFETAFVFLEEDYRNRDVPPWAIQIVLSEDALLEV